MTDGKKEKVDVSEDPLTVWELEGFCVCVVEGDDSFFPLSSRGRFGTFEDLRDVGK